MFNPLPLDLARSRQAGVLHNLRDSQRKEMERNKCLIEDTQVTQRFHCEVYI